VSGTVAKASTNALGSKLAAAFLKKSLVSSRMISLETEDTKVVY